MRLAKIGLAVLHSGAPFAVLLSALAAEDGKLFRSFVWALAALTAYVTVRVGSAVVRAQLEVKLARDVLKRVLDSDLFVEPLRLQHEAFVVGLYEHTRRDALILPSIYGSAFAAVLVSIVAASRGEAVRLSAFLVGLAFSSVIVIGARRYVIHASTRAWTQRHTHTQRMLDGLEGAEELVAAGGVGIFEGRVASGLRQLSRSSWVLGLESVFIGRFPIVVGVLAALITAMFVDPNHVPHHPTEWAVLGSMLPPFGGVVGGVASLIEIYGPTSAVRAALQRRPRAAGHAQSPKSVVPLHLSRVCVSYREEALRSVDVDVGDGLVVLTGSNGSGKSTLLRVLAGLVTPQSGVFVVGGVRGEELDWDVARSRIAYLPQRPYLPVGGRVRDAFEFLGVNDEATVLRVLADVRVLQVLVEKVPSDPLSTPVDQLSAGERQRVAIARTLARRAELYLLDEPDANLDSTGVEHLRDILRELSKASTVVVAAHTRELVAIADHVVELDRGVIQSERRPQPVTESLRVGNRR